MSTLMMPKRTKFAKRQKRMRNLRGIATRGNQVQWGDFGIKATERGRLTGRQIEAVRRVLARTTKRGAKIIIPLICDIPVTKKPLEVRQGKGKGSVESWVALIKPGRILFELEGIPEELARTAFKLAANKLPIKVRFVSRNIL